MIFGDFLRSPVGAPCGAVGLMAESLFVCKNEYEARITNGSGVRLPYWRATEMRGKAKAEATSRETSDRSDGKEPL